MELKWKWKIKEMELKWKKWHGKNSNERILKDVKYKIQIELSRYYVLNNYNQQLRLQKVHNYKLMSETVLKSCAEVLRHCRYKGNDNMQSLKEFLASTHDRSTTSGLSNLRSNVKHN